MAFLLHSDFLNPSVLIEELFYLHLQASAQTEGTPLNRCFGVRKEQSVVFPKKKKFSKYKYGGAWCGLVSFGMVLYCFFPWAHIRDNPEKERQRENEIDR